MSLQTLILLGLASAFILWFIYKKIKFAFKIALVLVVVLLGYAVYGYATNESNMALEVIEKLPESN